MPIATFYPADAEAIAKLSPERAGEFEKWLEELEVEHQRRGSPYGDKTLAKSTGLGCWFDFFDDNYSPADAIEEDLSA